MHPYNQDLYNVNSLKSKLDTSKEESPKYSLKWRHSYLEKKAK